MTPTRRAAPALAGLALLTVAAFAISVRVGSVTLDLRAILAALANTGDPSTAAIVRDLRVPRAAAAALIGAALAASGVTFQALLRNPLADPYVLGVSGGAALGAVASIVLGAFIPTGLSVSLAAFAGGALAIVLVLRIAAGVGRHSTRASSCWRASSSPRSRTRVFSSSLSVADVAAFRSATGWMMGTLSGSDVDGRPDADGVLHAGASCCSGFWPGRSTRSPSARDTAAYLGVSVERTKWLAYGAASLLAAAAVAAAVSSDSSVSIVPQPRD